MDPSRRIIDQNVKNGRERRGDLKGEIARQHLQHASISVKLDQALIERTSVAVGIDIDIHQRSLSCRRASSCGGNQEFQRF